MSNVQINNNCSFARNELDPLGKSIRVVSEAKFIAQKANDSIKLYATGEEVVKGYLSCVKVDSIYGVFFSFVVYSDSAHEVFGGVRKGDVVEFKLASGQSVDLAFGRTFSGNTNLSSGQTEYQSFGYLSPSSVSLLESSDISEVNIQWVKRKDSYQVVNPAVFRSQLPCLN